MALFGLGRIKSRTVYPDVIIVLLASYYDTYRWACGLINDIDKCLKRLNTVPNFSPNQGNITSFMLHELSYINNECFLGNAVIDALRSLQDVGTMV